MSNETAQTGTTPRAPAEDAPWDFFRIDDPRRLLVREVVRDWERQKASKETLAEEIAELDALIDPAPAPRPPAEDVIRDFFSVEEPTNRRLPDRNGRRS